MKKFLAHNRGFTLIELLVTISIIALLSSIILAALQGARQKGVTASALEFATANYHALGANEFLDWKFPSSGVVTDSSGYNIAGTLAGSPNFVSDSPYSNGGSVNLNSAAQYVSGTLANNASLQNIGAYTVSVWIKPESGFGGGYALEINNSNLNAGNRALMLAPSASSGIWFGDSDATASCFNVTNAVALNQGQWYNITYTYNYNETPQFAVYVNGTSIGYTNNTGGGCTGTSDTIKDITFSNLLVYVGPDSGTGGTGVLDAYVNEATIYSGSLSMNEVKQLYAQGAVAHGIALK